MMSDGDLVSILKVSWVLSLHHGRFGAAKNAVALVLAAMSFWLISRVLFSIFSFLFLFFVFRALSKVGGI